MTPEQTNELFRSLGRIESRLDSWDERLSEHMAADEAVEAALKVTLIEIEKRVRPMEKLMWKAAGAFTVISVAATELWRRVTS
jgi:hypothetical protein